MTTLAEELQDLHALKQRAEEVGRTKKDADAAFKQKQEVVLRRMQAEQADSFRTNGVLFTAIADRVKGQVDDRRLFVRWALENDEGIQEFLSWAIETWRYDPGDPDAFVEKLYDAIMNTSLVTYKENGTACNSMAKAHIDDETPLPPGLSFRPDPYIQQLKS